MLASPPLYKMRDLREWVTLTDIMDAHEALDLKAANAEKESPQG